MKCVCTRVNIIGFGRRYNSLLDDADADADADFLSSLYDRLKSSANGVCDIHYTQIGWVRKHLTVPFIMVDGGMNINERGPGESPDQAL